MYENDMLNARCDKLLSKNDCHVNDIFSLNKKIDYHESIICKFTSGRENLHKLLCNPNISYKKSRLGYNPYTVSSNNTPISVRKCNVVKIKICC